MKTYIKGERKQQPTNT